MLKQLILAATITFAISAPSAMAQQAFPTAQGGVSGAIGGVLNTLLTPAQPSGVGAMRNGLPATNTDSFVYESGLNESIYGDEGVYGPPPLFEFSKEKRINAGIFGQRDLGLTTGHGSYMPDAAGGDEFVKGPEFSVSGSSMGNVQPQTQLGQVVGAVVGAVGGAVGNAIGGGLGGGFAAPGVGGEPGF